MVFFNRDYAYAAERDPYMFRGVEANHELIEGFYIILKTNKWGRITLTSQELLVLGEQFAPALRPAFGVTTAVFIERVLLPIRNGIVNFLDGVFFRVPAARQHMFMTEFTYDAYVTLGEKHLETTVRLHRV